MSAIESSVMRLVDLVFPVILHVVVYFMSYQKNIFDNLNWIAYAQLMDNDPMPKSNITVDICNS